jgi:hypothetical protein
MTINKLRLVQIIHPERGRKVALVREPYLILLSRVRSVYELALESIYSQKPVRTFIYSVISEEKLDYDQLYRGEGSWKLLPSFDHPENPMNCLVSGTGLTHKTSALNRQMMHQADEGKLTDSMQIYQWGLEGGQPEAGHIGVQPEWFYKGTGVVLKAHGDVLELPPYANDGGEEPEVAGVYIIDKDGYPWRIGFTTGNEFSDHVMEKKNYLYLAPSKLRNCSLGPELVLDLEFQELEGKVSIERNGQTIWTKKIKTGEKNMAHSLANLEYHHFKYDQHRIYFQAHVHFFGADAFSFGDQVKLNQGDVMEIEWEGLGRALKNSLQISTEKEKHIVAKALSSL